MKRFIGLLLLAMTIFVGANAGNSVNMDSLRQEIVKNSKEIHDMQKDSVMVSKLTSEQVMELKKQEMEVEQARIAKESRSDMPFTGFQLFLIVMVPFIFVIVLFLISVKAKKDEGNRRYNLYLKSIEMGQTIPENFFDEPKKANPASNLKKGILWLSVGLAVFISFLIIGKSNGLFLGIIPAFVGIGYLLVHFLEKPKTDSNLNDNEQHG